MEPVSFFEREVQFGVSIINAENIASEVCSIFQHIIITFAIIRSVKQLSRKETVFVILARTSSCLTIKFHSGTVIGCMIGTTGLKSPKLVKTRINNKNPCCTYTLGPHINGVSGIG